MMASTDRILHAGSATITNTSSTDSLQPMDKVDLQKRPRSLTTEHLNRQDCPVACLPLRRVILILATLSGTFMLLHRYNLSVSIVQMTSLPDVTTSALGDEGDFSSRRLPWDTTEQGRILAAYFYPFALFNTLGGRLSDLWGPKWILFTGVMVPTLLTVLSPLVALSGHNGGYGPFIVLRILMGAFHAVVLPAAYALVNIWMPQREKTSALAIMQSGMFMGGLVATLATGYICDEPRLGWAWSFYVLGALPLLWMGPFIYYVQNRPAPVTEATLSIGHNCENSSKKKSTKRQSTLPPQPRWGAILTSRPVWASVAAKFTVGFGVFVITTKLPAFLVDRYSIPIRRNGIVNALPHLGFATTSILSAELSRWIQRRLSIPYDSVTLTRLRVCIQSVASLGPAVFIFLVPLMATSETVAEVLIVTSISLSGFCGGGEGPVIAEFAGVHSGTVFGFANTFSALSGVLAPIVTSEIVGRLGTGLGWDLVFYLISALLLIGWGLFTYLADVRLQNWTTNSAINDNNHHHHHRDQNKSSMSSSESENSDEDGITISVQCGQDLNRNHVKLT